MISGRAGVPEGGVLEPSSVAAHDRGFLFGDGLFETLRIYAGRPFRLDRHLERLVNGAERIGMLLPSDLHERVAGVIDRWRGGDAGLRITVTRPAGSTAGLLPDEGLVGRAHIFLRPWRDDPEMRGSGLRARTVGRIDEQALTASLKTLGYLERIQALRAARGEGAEEALLRNTTGRLVEGSASNLFALVDGMLLAPGPSDGALPGITREAILELVAETNVEVRERGIEPAELASAREVFLSSSLREVSSVIEIDGRAVGGGRPGPLAVELRDGLRRLVREELGLEP